MPSNLFDLTGKTALITGGATGLGFQFATALHCAGATVILSGRRKAILEEAAVKLHTNPKRVHCVAMDVSSAASIDAAMMELDAIDSLDGIDILINNAGAVAEPLLLELTEDEWDKVIDTNLKGVWLVARTVAARMIKQQRGGSIINIASVLAFASQNSAGPYAASKAGQVHLTRSMALEWARYGIRVNAIAPGYFHSDLTESFLTSPAGQQMIKRIPQQRPGKAGELDGAILLLASPASSYMTGGVITIDGGHSMAVL